MRKPGSNGAHRRKRRRRGSGRPQVPHGGAVCCVTVEALVTRTLERVRLAQRLDPLNEYAGRLYRCGRCSQLHAALAPQWELRHDKVCPTCGRPQVAVTGVFKP